MHSYKPDRAYGRVARRYLEAVAATYDLAVADDDGTEGLVTVAVA
jgi:hypothetical protein